MHSWREAVIELLRTALRVGCLATKMTVDEMEGILTQQEKRWWSIKIQTFKSKAHYLQYAGRYAKRPPIAQWRITHIGEGTVRFLAKDKRQKRLVYVQCSAEEFIDRWAQHIPERYQHSVRSFRHIPRDRGSLKSRGTLGTFAILRATWEHIPRA